MLPNVVGSKLDERTSDFPRLRLPASGNGAGSRRALSSKSAHLTTIPFEPSFVSPSRSQKQETHKKPYLPFSASPSRQRSNNLHQPTASASVTGGWRNGVGTNGYKSEYSFRARAHSHKNSRAETNNVTGKKSMPHLIDSKKSTVQKQGSVSVSSSPVDALDSNRAQEQCTREKDANEMVMMGTAKTSSVSGSVPLIASKVQGTKDRFQVCRTKEEKDKSPDCIRLDKCALRLFPDIGGGESVTLKMLSLQHNLITRLENVPLLSQLVVLDLYDNRVERITGLQGLPSLRVLLLGKNRIKRIEGMDNLKRLEILDLHGNQLRYVDNLGPLSSLRVLNLAGNLLRNIRNLGPYGMSSLTELNLKRNRIKNLDGLQKAPHLKRLLIANNELQNIASLAPLRKLLFLDELVVEPNPVTSAMNTTEYKNQVLTLFPNLSSLDRATVTDEMKIEARQWHKTKLAEEEARKKEEARIRQEMVASVGPPGSREQVIYQARRRWESLRNFVKSTNPTVSVEIKPKPIKSLKDAASATISAKHSKPRPNFNELYPPATLDLENFPDGQAELDKMESLLSQSTKNEHNESIQPQTSKENEKNNKIVPIAEDNEPPIVPRNHNHFHDELISALESLPLSQSAPSQGSCKDSESKGPPLKSTRLLIATKMTTIAPLQTETLKQSNAPSSTHSEAPQIPQPAKEVESEKTTDSARSNLSTASSKTVPDNKSSAKVAVVRPLIREFDKQSNKNRSDCSSGLIMAAPSEIQDRGQVSTNVVNVRQPKPEDGPFCPLKDAVSSYPVHDNISNGMFHNNKSDAKPTEVEALKVLPASETRWPINENSNNCNEALEENSIPLEPPQSSQSHLDKAESNVTVDHRPEGLIEACKDDIKLPTNSDDLPNSNSYQTRAKLLRHLRSMSLDSGMEPPQNMESPPELCNGNPEEDVEDEDDNDNEVKDLECEYDYDDDACSVSNSTVTTTCTSASTTPRRSSTVIATTNRLLKSNGSFRKPTFPRTKSQRMRLRDRAAKLFGSSSDLSPRSTSTAAKRSGSGVGSRTTESQGPIHSLKPPPNGKTLRRCDSAANLTSMAPTSTTASASVMNATATTSKASGANGNIVDDLGGTPFRKQGVDFLVEIEGKSLNVFGQGGLRHALTAFTSNVTCHVNVAKFHYITFDSIIPFFGKLRQVYPSLEHFHFRYGMQSKLWNERANNLCTLAQLDALSDLQGLSSLCIAKEGNPIVAHEAWAHFASYRLSHWGLQVINGKEISSEYRGGVAPAAQSKCFESLGFLALSCLPQTALTPLAKRLHMLHCFCCCSPSTSSDESNRAQRLIGNHRIHSPSQQADHATSGNFCTAWDDDPVLLDVIGKEALVYCPPPLEGDANPSELGNGPSTSKEHDKTAEDKAGVKREQFEKKRLETLKNLIKSGVEIAEKVDRLERTWPTLLTDVIQEVLMDYRFMDSYMKKELKKAQDATLIASNHNQQHHGKKRH